MPVAMQGFDGVYRVGGVHAPVFRQVAAPDASQLKQLVEQIAARVGQVLERRGLIERDIEDAWLISVAEPGPLYDLIGHSITYWIAVGPRAGQMLFTLQAVYCQVRDAPPCGDEPGAAPNARVRQRDRQLRTSQWQAQDHRQHQAA